MNGEKKEDNFFKRIFQKVIENISLIIIMAALGLAYNWIAGIVDSPDEIKRMKEKMRNDSTMIVLKYQIQQESLYRTIDSLRKDIKNLKQWELEDYENIRKIKLQLGIQ